MSTEAKRNIYKGHRYVPLIAGEWNKEESYEGLTIVLNEGNSYTSKKRVPVGIDILNEDYWVLTGNYNAQIDGYRQDVKDLKVDLEDSINLIDKQLSEIVTNVKNYGAIGDGLTDDSNSIVNASNDGVLFFPDGHYKLNSLPDKLELQGIIGNGVNKTIIEFPTNTELGLKDGFLLNNVTIIYNSSRSNSNPESIPSLFKSYSIIENVTFENIIYKTNASESGSDRGSGILDGRLKHSTFRNIEINGTRTGFIFRGNGKMFNTFENIYFKNVETGFYVKGEGSPSENGSVNDFHGELNFNNIKLENTIQQQQNFTKINGSDLFMFEKVEDVFISNIYCERPCERVGYFNYVKNIVYDRFIHKNCEGIKFVGYADELMNVFNISENFKMTNGIHDYGIDLNSSYMLNIHYVNGIEVDNIKVIGSPSVEANQQLMDAVINSAYHVHNVNISRVNGENFSRGFMLMISRGLMSGERKNIFGFKNINIENCDIKNFSNYSSSYDFIRLLVDDEVTNSFDGFLYDGLNINNNKVNHDKNNRNLIGYESSRGEFNALIYLPKLTRNVSIKGNDINGFISNSVINSDLECENINIDLKIKQTSNTITSISSVADIGSKVIRETNSVNFQSYDKVTAVSSNVRLSSKLNREKNINGTIKPTDDKLLLGSVTGAHKWLVGKIFIMKTDDFSVSYTSDFNIKIPNNLISFEGDPLISSDESSEFRLYVESNLLYFKNNSDTPINFNIEYNQLLF